jgi:hypothetical protein
VAGGQGEVGPWVKINERDGIVAYARTNPLIPVKQCRYEGVIDASAENVERMLRDWNSYRKILFMSKKVGPAHFPGCKPTADTYCVYLLQGAPWPVEDRDGYGSLSFYLHQPTGEILAKVRVEQNDMPLTKGVTRVPFCEMEWMIKPIDAGHCRVIYQNLLQPGGAVDKLPAPVINYVMKYFGIFGFQSIRKMAKDDRYQQPLKGYITQTPWPEELRFYAEEVKTKS